MSDILSDSDVEGFLFCFFDFMGIGAVTLGIPTYTVL